MNPAGTQLGTRVAFSFETLAHDARLRERHAAARGKHSLARNGIDGGFFAKTISSRKRETRKRENAKTRR